MNLIVFPGLGNPDSPKYTSVYATIREAAINYGYTDVDVGLRWPGHVSGGSEPSQAVTLGGSVQSATRLLEEAEREGTEYAVLGRSFGCVVACECLNGPRTYKRLRRVILWGPPCFWVPWTLFVRDLGQNAASGREKGVVIDETFFGSLKPIEALLPALTIPCIVATGEHDPFCSPAFLTYLRSLCENNPKIVFRDPVANAPHEVTAALPPATVDAYAATLFAPPKACLGLATFPFE